MHRFFFCRVMKIEILFSEYVSLPKPDRPCLSKEEFQDLRDRRDKTDILAYVID